MADRPPRPDTGNQAGEPERESTSGVSRWIRVVGLILAVIILLVLVMVLLGSGIEGHQIPQHAPPPADMAALSAQIRHLA